MLAVKSKKLISYNIRKSNEFKSPMFIIVIATKPCYIKLYSLIKEFKEKRIPFLAIETGQHYSSELVNHKFEYSFSDLISVVFDSHDDLLLRNNYLVCNIDLLLILFKKLKLQNIAIPIVSGDTMSAAQFAQNWYFRTRVRSVHVEAGLRSYSPKSEIKYDNISSIRNQKKLSWVINRELPFPETDCSRMASQFSDLLFAPVKLNYENLIFEGYERKKIMVSGSLSSDAINDVRFFNSKKSKSVFDMFPSLIHKKWVRIDMHRRENMKIEVLEPLLKSIEEYTSSNGNVVLIVSNLFHKTFPIDKLEYRFKKQINSGSIIISNIWANYSDVIEFIDSPYCLGVITDSGGLQEELTILKKPCFIYRNSTDRLEAIQDTDNNLLLFPFTVDNINSALSILKNNKFYVKETKATHQKSIYKNKVAEKITSAIIRHYKIKTY